MISVKNHLWLICLLVLSLKIQSSDDDRGYSPLHNAAYNNHPNIVEYLISQGADVNDGRGRFTRSDMRFPDGAGGPISLATVILMSL